MTDSPLDADLDLLLDATDLELRDALVDTLRQLADELEMMAAEPNGAAGPSDDTRSEGGFADRVFTQVIRGGAPAGSDNDAADEHIGTDRDHTSGAPSDHDPERPNGADQR
jgi:hypothetical protein